MVSDATAPNVCDAVDIDWAKSRESFRELGYIQINGLIPPAHYDAIEKSYLTLLQKYAPERFNAFEAPGMIEEQRFHDAALRFKQELPRLSGAVYDAMQCALPVVTVKAEGAVKAKAPALASAR